MQMIPRSRREDMRDQETTHDPDDVLLQSRTITNVGDSLTVSCELEPGEVSLHHGWTVHYCHRNLSDDRRIGLSAQYILPSMRQTKSDHDSAMLLRGGVCAGHISSVCGGGMWVGTGCTCGWVGLSG